MKKKILDTFNNPNIQAISGMDATFLYGESATNHMHVGSVAVIEGSLKFETFKQIIQSRIHLMPKMRQKLMYVPLSIDYPYWVDDPSFDIDLHMKHIALPKPGGWKELRDVASKEFSEPLEQSRALWSFTFVEGLDSIPQLPPGSVAIISKMHHVAIDGVGGAELLSVIFDLSSEKKDIPAPKPFKPKPLPNELALMMKSSLSFAQDPLKFPKILTNAVTATLKTGIFSRVQKANLPTAPFTAPNTPINGIISARRKWNTAILTLDRVLALKKIMGTTMNDVMLAICAGALRRYLIEKDKLPNKPMVAMIPVSTKNAADTEGSGSNQIVPMLVQIATNIEDPIERLNVIHENTARGKTYQGAIGTKSLASMAEVVPFGVANQAARLYSRFQVSNLHNPIFNLSITNVPGPNLPLYIHGHKLMTIMGMAPIIDGMGLIITILSYNGLVTVSPTSDVNSMPDLDLFTRYIRESANELEAAVLAFAENQPKKDGKAAKKTAEKAESDPLFESLKKFLKKQPKEEAPKGGVFQFVVKGAVPTDWTIDLTTNPGSVKKAKAASPDVSFIIEDEHLMKIKNGKLDIQTAFIQGRLKIEGDFTLAMKLGKILGRMMREEASGAA